MNTRSKRFLSVMLAFVICLGFSGGYTLPTRAENGHWSENAITTMQKYNSLDIFDGNFNPDEAITRAEFVALVNRAFGFTRTIGAKTYADVDYSGKYGEDIKISSAMGYMFDYGLRFLPDDSLSRERAYSILAGIYLLTDEARVKTRFTDDENIGQWSRPEISAMDKAGYLESFQDGTLHPEKELTKGEAAQVLVNMLGNRPAFDRLSDAVSTYKNLTIYRPGLTIKNVIVTNDLFISNGVGDGDVHFENIKVSGYSLIMGGGSNSVTFKNSVLANVIVGGFNYTNFSTDKVCFDNLTFMNSGILTLPRASINFNAATGVLTLKGIFDEILDLGNGTFKITYEGKSFILAFGRDVSVSMINNLSILSSYKPYVPTGDGGGSGGSSGGGYAITSQGALYLVTVGYCNDSGNGLLGTVSIDGTNELYKYFLLGEMATVSASALGPNSFGSWYSHPDRIDGSFASEDARYTFEVTEHRQLYATFNPMFIPE